jgi:hypothetical protein
LEFRGFGQDRIAPIRLRRGFGGQDAQVRVLKRLKTYKNLQKLTKTIPKFTKTIPKRLKIFENIQNFFTYMRI